MSGYFYDFNLMVFLVSLLCRCNDEMAMTVYFFLLVILFFFTFYRQLFSIYLSLQKAVYR